MSALHDVAPEAADAIRGIAGALHSGGNSGNLSQHLHSNAVPPSAASAPAPSGGEGSLFGGGVRSRKKAAPKKAKKNAYFRPF